MGSRAPRARPYHSGGILWLPLLSKSSTTAGRVGYRYRILGTTERLRRAQISTARRTALVELAAVDRFSRDELFSARRSKSTRAPTPAPTD